MGQNPFRRSAHPFPSHFPEHYANPIARFEHLVSTYQLQNRFAFVHTHVVSRLTQTQADGGQWLALAVAARAKD